MESIRELRQICQAPRKTVDNWHMKHISRKPSIYITWLLLHTKITANGATFLFLLTGIIASLAYIFATNTAFLIGSVLLQLWYVMDMVDGEIARYRKQTSLTGAYFDCVSHYISHPFLFFCIGVGLYVREGDNPAIFLISLLAGYSVAMITISTDVMRSVLYEKVKNGSPVKGGNNSEEGKAGKSIFSKAFSMLHTLCVMPAIMDTLFLVTIVDYFTDLNMVSLLIKFYAAGATLVWVARISHFILKKKLG